MNDRITTDVLDPRLKHGFDEEETPQSKVYLVLSQEEREAGYVRPVRISYIHRTCGAKTTMNQEIAETFAADPWFYGATYCCVCGMHRPVTEFRWTDGSVVGS